MEKTKGKCPVCGELYTLRADGCVRKHKNPSGPGDCGGVGLSPNHTSHCRCAPCPMEYCPEDPWRSCEKCATGEGKPVGPVDLTAPDGDLFQSPAPVNAPPRPAQVTPDLPDWKGLTESWGPVHGFGTAGPGDFNRYRHYVMNGGSYVRASTFAKTMIDTYSLDQWGNRNVVLGLSKRPDLVERARNLHVSYDAKTLNWIAEEAKNTAGHKVKAELGSAYHAFSEYLDSGKKTLDDVPEMFRKRLAEYLGEMQRFGLTTRPEWIERTTACSGLQVAGTLDRILGCPDRENRVGDVKTGDNAVKFGSLEISVQLAVYVLGANENGLYDWTTRQWVPLEKPLAEDFAIVMHLPAGGEGCQLHKVDLAKGMKYARQSLETRRARKDKEIFSPLTAEDMSPRRLPPPDFTWFYKAFANAESQHELADLYERAKASGDIDQDQLRTLVDVGQIRAGTLRTR